MAGVQFRTEATVVDKLLLIPHFCKVLLAVVVRMGTILFDKDKPKSPFKSLVYTGLRTNLANLSVPQEQYILSGTTQDAYLACAKKNKFRPETTVLSSGLRLHWLGPKTSEKVILFFHGGGYAMPASIGHVQLLLDMQQQLSKKASFSVILVQYSLIPYTQFPGQLQEAAESLYWLVEKQSKKPGDIFIAGDSAGGNLTLALLSHLLHPHDKATKIELKEPLGGAVLISPWVKFSSEDWSWTKNKLNDMLPAKAVARWSSMFVGGNTPDAYMEPVRGDQKWWSGLDGVVSGILVWGGSHEVLLDSIEHMGEILKEAHPKTEVVITSGAAHDEPIIDRVIDVKEKHEATALIESWIAERL